MKECLEDMPLRRSQPEMNQSEEVDVGVLVSDFEIKRGKRKFQEISNNFS